MRRKSSNKVIEAQYLESLASSIAENELEIIELSNSTLQKISNLKVKSALNQHKLIAHIKKYGQKTAEEIIQVFKDNRVDMDLLSSILIY
jgi:hypothetical protein